jgi:hypothetical protein
VSKVRRAVRTNQPLVSRQQQRVQGFYQLHGKMIRFRGMGWGNALTGGLVVSVPD